MVLTQSSRSYSHGYGVEAILEPLICEIHSFTATPVLRIRWRPIANDSEGGQNRPSALSSEAPPPLADCDHIPMDSRTHESVAEAGSCVCVNRSDSKRRNLDRFSSVSVFAAGLSRFRPFYVAVWTASQEGRTF
jgi:hypothetical protein